ncbi:MAG: adenylate/guanylate cyclase domain-containing protein [Candidatus Pacearchaeota archaeon]|nr:adenylate/guanylate cyclase domain-containing protein [Candidatus Pacearchaeota archaeon]
MKKRGVILVLIILFVLAATASLGMAKEIVIEINKEYFVPGEVLMITPKIVDGSDIAEGAVSVRLSSRERRFPFFYKETVLVEEVVQSGKDTLYRFVRGTLPGEYIIEATAESGKLSAKRTVTVEEFEKLGFNLEEGILKITNEGNVPYKKAIEIEFRIHDQITKKKVALDLDVGEVQEFKLEAPKGTYDLAFISSKETFEIVDVPLTGNIVATIELETPKQPMNNWILAMVLLIIAAFLLVLYIKQKQERKPKAKEHREIINVDKRMAGEQVILKPTENVSNEIKVAFNRHASKLAARAIIPSLVYGTKQEISVLMMPIHGFGQFNELRKKDPVAFSKIFDRYFEAVIEKIRSHQGVADLYGNNLIVFFNVIKSYRHDVAAVRTAEEIREITNAFNASIKGLNAALSIKAGINTGFAVVSSIGEDKTIKYTSIGNTMSLAKALTNKALAGEILIPENVYERVSGVVNAKKIMPLYLTDTEAIEVYSIKEAKEMREKHEWFVKRALGKG